MSRSIHVCAMLTVLLGTGLVATGCDQKTHETTTTTEAPTEATTSTEAPSDEANDELAADEGDDPDVDAQPAAGIDTAATLERLAGRLPADTVAVVLLDVDGVLESDLLAAIGGQLSEAQRKSFRDDIGDYLKKNLGVDPTGAEWIAVAMGTGQWIAAITPGPLALADGLEPIEAGTVKGTGLRIEDAAVFELGDGLQAIVAARGMIGSLVPAPTEPLSGTESWARMKKVSGAVGGGLILVADLSNPLTRAAAAGKLPAPLRELDAFAVSFGGGLAAAATGSPAAIENLETMFGELQGQGRSSIDAMYARRDDLDMGQGLLAIVGHHLYDPLVSASKPSFDGDLVTLDLRGDDLQTVVALIGVSAAIAVPTFQRYIADSKSSEARANLSAIADGALVYHHEEHVDDPSAVAVVTGVYPEAAQPVCTTALSPQGDKLSPDATEWTEGPWRDLRFSISRPHYFEYCYQSSPDRKAFAAWASAALSGLGAADTRLCVRGLTSADGPRVGPVEEIAPDAPCAP